jgi:flagellar hook-length control protein FliK
MSAPAVGWSDQQALAAPTLSAAVPLPPSFAPPSAFSPAPAAPSPAGESAAEGTAGGTKKSFSAAELDHVPRYIAPEDDQPGTVSSPSQPRHVSAAWQPNELASFSGAEWVPPALAHEEVAAYVAPKVASSEPPRSPRNLIIAVAGVAVVAGLGFGVNKALAPDNAKVIVETTTVETTVKSATSVSTTLATRPVQVSAAPAGGLIISSGPASDAASAALSGVAGTATTAPAARAPGIVGAANAAGAAISTASADPALAEDSATTAPAP